MKITLAAEVVVNRSPIDEEIAQLHRDATASKEAKNWDEAVTYLKKANELMAQSSIEYGIDRWLRLPLFLQQAGKMDEADMYFSWLLSDVDRQVAAGIGHQSANVQAAAKHGMCAGIYDKWRLAWKREKQAAKVEYYEALAKEQQDLAAYYRTLIDQERELRLARKSSVRDRQQVEPPASTWLPPVRVEIVNKTLDGVARHDKRYAAVTRPESSITPASNDTESQQGPATLLAGVIGLVLIVSLLIWIF